MAVKSTYDFLRDIDEQLIQYDQKLCDMGFSNTKFLKVMPLDCLNFIQKPGHRLLISQQLHRLSQPAA